jgi:hypothetical protein
MVDEYKNSYGGTISSMVQFSSSVSQQNYLVHGLPEANDIILNKQADQCHNKM